MLGKDSKEIKKAIDFLKYNFKKSGNNPKPVVEHSIRVASYLEENGYSEKIVVSALLHDLIEDTEITKEELEKDFGKDVAKIVEANSFDKEILDPVIQYQDLFERCFKEGEDSLIVKAADILDNSSYYGDNQKLIDKMKYFIELSKNKIENEQVWEELSEKYKSLSSKSKSFELAKSFLGKKVEVKIDRPLGSKHPKHNFTYEVNYGYIPKVKAPDGEELDAYFLGTGIPLEKANGICIAIIHREDDDDDKLVVAPKGVDFFDEEILRLVDFQEKYFKSRVVRN